MNKHLRFSRDDNSFSRFNVTVGHGVKYGLDLTWEAYKSQQARGERMTAGEATAVMEAIADGHNYTNEEDDAEQFAYPIFTFPT